MYYYISKYLGWSILVEELKCFHVIFTAMTFRLTHMTATELILPCARVFSAIIGIESTKTKKKWEKFWVRKWGKRRDHLGASATLVRKFSSIDMFRQLLEKVLSQRHGKFSY